MAHTIQRLTIYALVSSIEIDLRDIVSTYIAPHVNFASIFPDAMKKKASDRFSKEYPESVPDVDDLLLFLDFGDVLSVILSHEKRIDSLLLPFIKRFYGLLNNVIGIRNRVMHSRPLEFDDLLHATNLAAELERSNRSLWPNVRTMLRELERNPELVTQLTIPESVDETTKVLHNLPQVEFDDTGFVGRDKELNDLRRALIGSYPVVSVVGEGGLGKTAIALKVCYEMLDKEGVNLDAIIWATAKTTKLTANEIQLIDNAISSSLGIIESAAATLGRQAGTAAFDDLIQHLTNNRILLVIDNLETVVDQTITDLVRQIPEGSRILFTTRIGLGAFNFPVPIHPMNKKESASYFRGAAHAWGVKEMASATQPVVESFCERLQHNPLFIKSFMQSVKVGGRPSQLVSEPTVLLQFCLQNVFNALPLDSQTVVKVLAGVSGPQSIASLSFYTSLESLSVQSALSFLITSNLVSSERGRSSEDEDRFVLSALARLYIQKFLKPSIDEQKKLLAKQNQLKSAQEDYQARVGSDIFDINYVFIREKDDYIVAIMLTKAIDAIFRGRLEVAETEIERAQTLSPNYFEVHRVRAFFAMNQEDFFGAESAFEAAISLAPERAPLRLWYGGFLSRSLGDSDRALSQYLEAERLAPTSSIVKLESARVLQYLRRFDEASTRLNAIDDIENLSSRTRRVHLDLILQNSMRKSEYLAGKEEWVAALACLEKMHKDFHVASEVLIDQRTLKNLHRARRNMPPLRRALVGLEDNRLKNIDQWLSEKLFKDPQAGEGQSNTPAETGLAERGPILGEVRALQSTFGFIVSEAGRDYFFHRSNCYSSSTFRSLYIGQRVRFRVGQRSNGQYAAYEVAGYSGEATTFTAE